MLPMTRFRHIYDTVTGLAEHGRQLPAAERLAWRALAGDEELQQLADQEGSYSLPRNAPADYAEAVRMLHGQLAVMDTPAASLVASWVAAWLAEHADQTTHGAQAHTPALGIAREGPEQPQRFGTGHRRWGMPAARRDTHWPTMPLHRGWALLLISGAMVVGTVVDTWCLVAISSVAELTCAADDRPWQWRQVGDQLQIHIGPPQTFGDPSAGQLAADLAHLANGLNPGRWSISTRAGTSNKRHPRR
jgi:hypothetical protein